MKLTKALLGDSLGVQLAVPEEWRLVGESDEAAHLLQDEPQVKWWLFWFPGVELALGKGDEGEDAGIEKGMRHYAKAMFESVFRDRQKQEASGGVGSEAGSATGEGEDDDGEEEDKEGEEGESEGEEGADDGDNDDDRIAVAAAAGVSANAGDKSANGEDASPKFKGAWFPDEPRTADPEWSAMVDCERVQVGGATALWTVHRMAYQPGDEIVMGHLMVPVKGGLFEVRLAARDEMTGVRESMMLIEQPGKLLKQKDYDDPKHDEKFEMHSLSRVRKALRWLIEDAGLKVLAPAAVHEGGEVVLSRLDCALVPPRRFVRTEKMDDYNLAAFQRVGFCGTDGIEQMLVQRVDELRKLTAEQLRGEAEVFSRGLNESSGLREVKLAVEEVTVGERRCVLIVADGEGDDGGRRNSLCWLLDRKGRAYFVAILGSDAVPAEVRRDELRTTVASWRSTKDGKAWWKLW